MYTTAFIFSSFPSISLAVYAIVSQVYLLVIKLHISKSSYNYLVFSLYIYIYIYCFDLHFALFLKMCINLKMKTKGKEMCIIKKPYMKACVSWRYISTYSQNPH